MCMKYSAFLWGWFSLEQNFSVVRSVSCSFRLWVCGLAGRAGLIMGLRLLLMRLGELSVLCAYMCLSGCEL